MGDGFGHNRHYVARIEIMRLPCAVRRPTHGTQPSLRFFPHYVPLIVVCDAVFHAAC